MRRRRAYPGSPCSMLCVSMHRRCGKRCRCARDKKSSDAFVVGMMFIGIACHPKGPPSSDRASTLVGSEWKRAISCPLLMTGKDFLRGWRLGKEALSFAVATSSWRQALISETMRPISGFCSACTGMASSSRIRSVSASLAILPAEPSLLPEPRTPRSSSADLPLAQHSVS